MRNKIAIRSGLRRACNQAFPVFVPSLLQYVEHHEDSEHREALLEIQRPLQGRDFPAQDQRGVQVSGSSQRVADARKTDESLAAA